MMKSYPFVRHLNSTLPKTTAASPELRLPALARAPCQIPGRQRQGQERCPDEVEQVASEEGDPLRYYMVVRTRTRRWSTRIHSNAQARIRPARAPEAVPPEPGSCASRLPAANGLSWCDGAEDRCLSAAGRLVQGIRAKTPVREKRLVLVVVIALIQIAGIDVTPAQQTVV